MLFALTVTTLILSSPEPLAADTQRWHDQRLSRLGAEDGWLSLVGLFWLEEGENLAGSNPKALVVLPAGAPEQLGSFWREGLEVRFEPAPGVALTRNGQPFSGGALATDEGQAADLLRVGTLQLLVLSRGERLGVRVRDSEAPARKHFAGILRFPVRPAWRLEAKWQPAQKGRTVPVPNVLGQISEVPLAGTATFTVEGKEYGLLATLDGDSLFFVFGDASNRLDTYGAGRFLVSEPPREGKVVLDFNRAYNPPCAFSPHATCPLPVKENKLSLRIDAGEKRYQDH